MNQVSRIAAIGLAFAAASLSESALALAPTCITHNDSTGLTNALAAAANSGVSAEIDVEQGTYIVPPTGWIYSFSPEQDVALLGGFVPGTNCKQRQITASPNTAATNTILDGQSQNGAFISLGLKLGGNPGNLPYGTLTIEGFEMRHLQSTGAGGSALFATFDVGDGYTGGILFRYNWVHDSVAAASIVELHTGGPMTFTNNLVDKNIGAESVYLLSTAGNQAPWRIVNNTIANNTGEGLVTHQIGTYVQLFNNILYANTSSDLDATNSFLELHGDTYGTSTTSGGSIANHGYAFSGTNPQYDTTTFHLTSGSGSINTGAGYASVLPAQDLDGNPRWVGSNPDRGAFESNTFDQAYWVVTDTADTSHASDSTVNCNPGSHTCTLREAIVRANAYGASEIGFDLGGSCGPQLILLTSPLPNVNVPLLIDGFTQPGSVRSTAPIGSGATFDETLCVVVEGTIADSVPSALVVGSTNFGAQLEVRGVTFEGFTGPAISIAQGAYHWIHGNTFGAETDTNPFVFSNGAGVTFGSGVTFSTIGGSAAADVNIFGKMNDSTRAAIAVTSTPNGHIGNALVGNFVGYSPIGGDKPNQGTGVLLQSTSYNEVYENTIVASALDGLDLNAANANWIHDNRIGAVTQYGYFYVADQSNGGNGIAVYAGSTGNHIGAFDDTAYQTRYSNEIQNNAQAGVWVLSSAGAGNTVLANAIGYNGPSFGGDLGIDTGPFGTGVASGTPTITVTTSYTLGYATLDLNFLTTGTGGTTYRVDFYNSDGCDASGYGPAEVPVQTFSFAMPGSGFQIAGFNEILPIVPLGQTPAHLSATITDTSTHTTSQISNCTVAVNDRIFNNGFEPIVTSF
ncbi:MAG TPA: right-handed parallel beta-helix repeat-containing protein [Rudaea sp.]|nr:right-handed parallel beta-helix repeat-containing protein [Rudaea sp.]